jgi:alkanesulfonate monooxygenase SsuD/methylene tetrahydromethanopterin reductase-like flavin-dependent oxidoreductase (luciferase family)
MFFSPKADGFYREALAEGFARPGARQTPDTFEVACVVPTIVGDDVEACADLLRPMYALYIGGMGARGKNFYNDLARRYGYEREAELVQDLYLSGRKREAEAAVPEDLLRATSLIGPKEYVADRLAELAACGVTTVSVKPLADSPAGRVAAIELLRDLMP